MTYQVFAQKYRPQTFDDVIGQEAVTRTIKNSISSGRVANAYIFCGPRGVGKTSVARLLAKMLNCSNPGELGPCNKCASCMEITRGSSIDVLEIDGASNRGIDEIRTLRENVKFSPSKGKYKVYIIDEVHMLTQEAFNALLKTLEEPPAHVKFIFATTEGHKVLPTIMSRCQRFDFKRIPPRLIYNRLADIAKKEKINIEEKAALLISRSADGSLRDALVILDQMVSFVDEKIQTEDVLELLGMVHKDKILELSAAIGSKDVKKAMLLLDEIIDNGKDPVFITNSLISHYRDLMILKVAETPTQDMAFTEEELDKMNNQLKDLSVEEILYVLQNLSQCLVMMKGTMFTRAPLEISIIRLAKRDNIFSLPEMLDQLGKIEKMDVPLKEKKSEQRIVDTENDVEETAQMNNVVQEKEDNQQSSNSYADGNFEDHHWDTILKYVKKKKMSVYTFLCPGKLIEFNKKHVVIGFSMDHAFNKEVLETEINKKLVQEALKDVLGGNISVEFKTLEFLGGKNVDQEEEEKKSLKAKEAMKPIIEKALDIFGGHVIRDMNGGTN